MKTHICLTLQTFIPEEYKCSEKYENILITEEYLEKYVTEIVVPFFKYFSDVTLFDELCSRMSDNVCTASSTQNCLTRMAIFPPLQQYLEFF